MELSSRHRHTLIALACKVAWADGVVADGERAQVLALIEKIGGAPVTEEELDLWLSTEAPPAELAELPAPIREMFLYEAMKLVEADGETSDAEVRLLETLMARVAERQTAATPIARIVVAKRPPGR